MDTLENKDVVTRKEHHCFGCGRKFPKGSKLNFNKIVDGGTISSAYWCPVCIEYWSRYMENGDEIGYGELKSEDFEGWDKIRKEMEIVSQEQLRIMKHMLGLDYKKKPYRNYFYSHSIQEDIEDLIKNDLALSKDASNNRDIVYCLTKKGVEFIINKEISQKEYNEL